MSNKVENHENYLAAITFSSLFDPVLGILEKDNNRKHSAKILRQALRNADSEEPGFLLEFVKSLLAQYDLNNTRELNEIVLRLQERLPANDLQIENRGPVNEQLSRCAIEFRNSLSRIPGEIEDRRSFIERLRIIAGNMAQFINAIDKLLRSLTNRTDLWRMVEKDKQNFIADSRQFKETLLGYFSNNQDTTKVFVAANRLIYQTTVIIETARQISNKK